ncbi:ataxin-7 [Ictalurus punctatus]|uniref:Ataxin-7 n=1 Tax=Ictalurus punctatus TaxID=7998 RepID=A0A2D0PLX3_ICTPU|nr:ataxin-7 [Ictalurus punctatus]XP_017306059.1 ataxin-7 [Ictalurus punctatus]XP_017306060.1 ataxin-7 [Ictalurus punctatus]
MSERDEEGEPRAEQRARAPPRHQQQRTEGASAMAAIGERAASLPSPEVMLGQAWSCWVDAAKLHATDGIEPEESFKECGRNREAMRLCRDDMPIFGQCPAQDDFYLVMCSHCSQVVKPQAFQAHFERRHSSINKPALSYSSSAALPGLPSRARTGGAGGGGPASTMPVGSSSSSAGGSNNTHTAKEKLPHRKPHFPPKVLHNDILTPAVKVEKIHVKMDYASSKPGHVPASSSSSSCSTVSSSPSKPGLNSQSIPKAHQASPGHIPNGKSHLSPLSKKQDSSTNASSKRPPRKVLEREFNPDVHCGVMDIGARKPCTRSLTCKTHSLSQRRAVPGRRKRFDVLLAEHKGRAREKELQQQPHRTEPSQQTPPPLRETHPPSHHGNPTATTDATKLFPLSKTKPHNPVLPRNSSHSGLSSLGDAAATPDPTLHPHLALTPDGAACPSSDEGENEEREESMDKLDCHYSGYHPRPASFCTFGSRLFGRSCYLFDRRWDRVQYALVAMMDKHVNSLMWKKIPLALENSSSSSSSLAAVTSSHRSSTNSLSSSSGFLSPSPPPPYSQSHDSKPTLSYGTTLNARVTSQRAGEQLAYSGGGSSRQVSSSSPQMPSAHSSSLPSAPGSNKSIKSRTGPKHFWVKEPSPASLASSSANNNSSSSDTSGVSVSSNSAISLGSTKKRKNSSLKYGAESSPSSSSSSLKKNCMANSGTSGSSFHSSLTSTAASVAFSSSSSSSSSHSAGMNCPPGRGNSMSARQEAAEPIKRMSVMMNSSDSTLSLGPFVNNPDGRTDTKRRKSSQATSSLTGTATCTASAGGGGGAQGPGRPKMAKSPAINNIHGKHTRPMPGTPGLPNNSLIHQPKARP